MRDLRRLAAYLTIADIERVIDWPIQQDRAIISECDDDEIAYLNAKLEWRTRIQEAIAPIMAEMREVAGDYDPDTDDDDE